MTYVALRSHRSPRQERRRRRNRMLLAVSVGALGLAGARLGGGSDAAPMSVAAVPASVAAVPVSVAAASETAAARPLPADYAWMLDPTPAIGATLLTGPLSLGPLASGFQRAEPAPAVDVRVAAADAPPEAVPSEAAPSAVQMAATPARSTPVAATLPRPEQVALSVPLPIPLPVPRPAEFRRAPVAVTARLARRPALPSTQSVFRAAGVEEPSLFDRIFGDAPAPTAYASVDGASEAVPSRQRLVPGPAPVAGGGIAIYDITAGRVTLPNGEVLEAHSGLGPSQDNPRNVHLTMRGATPPGTYDLREREALFHGVRAIRLNPVGGPAAIHGRVGLLAHTYMLGPSGASNGCVVFRDYNRFLQAYLRGEVQRLVVVAGNGQDGPPLNGRRYGLASR
ncbi:DUF2778 domain-containing protein [Methylobacterium sp. Leaf112]|uniref:DUF2778 domain-containing protein n=1 Tax=Methylobacterium sp. Leaf112 TaxID=1736258 RepID=UPI0006FAB913|nr:DUF2778 domain-containing protein [Methylobacterium sp. Leaf112]KQP59032.1 hypothetical protein ASF52_13075 [Methylobacterium sp. Leaf112]